MTAARAATADFVARQHDLKYAFDTREEAEAHLREVWVARLRAHFDSGVEPPRLERDVYQCPRCPKFHITSLEQPSGLRDNAEETR